MKYLNYNDFDMLNGDGIRVTIWLSRCSHACDGCFNKVSWKNVGEEVSEAFIAKLLHDLSSEYIRGLTLSGGDPLHHKNREEVINLCKLVKNKLPDKDIWLYTGYTLLEIQSDSSMKEILDYIDVLVDGKYMKDLPSKPFRGSSNQSIWNVSDVSNIVSHEKD